MKLHTARFAGVFLALFISDITPVVAAEDAVIQRRPHARVLATLVQPTEDGADNGAGVLFEYAKPSEENPNGDFLVEAGWIGWDQSESVDGFSVSADANLVPLLLGYRHRFPFGRESRARLELGAALGAVYSRIEAEATDGFTILVLRSSRWNFAWGGEAAVGYQISDNFEALIGYKYISTDAGSVRVDGERYDLGSLDCHVFTAGFGWSW